MERCYVYRNTDLAVGKAPCSTAIRCLRISFDFYLTVCGIPPACDDFAAARTSSRSFRPSSMFDRV